MTLPRLEAVDCLCTQVRRGARSSRETRSLLTWLTRCRTAFDVQVLQKCADIQEHISEGATSFLLTEYNYMAVFMV